MGATAPTHRPAANCEDSNLRDSCQSWSTMKGGEQSMLSALTHTQMLLPPSRPPPAGLYGAGGADVGLSRM
jgi:hypothetical protein